MNVTFPKDSVSSFFTPRRIVLVLWVVLLFGVGAAIRFYDLRHTAASLMLNNNIPPIVVSRRLGHAKASITLDVYGHLIPSMQTEVADKIDELIMPVAV